MLSHCTPVLHGPAQDRGTDAALILIRDLIYRNAGIFQTDNRLRFLQDRCLRRMQALGIYDMQQYYECLASKPMRQAELASLLNEITVGETCFFRNRMQLEAIRNVVLPAIMSARSERKARILRFWSAGCSTGEEPYTLAMLLLEESQARLRGWTFEVLATDINERSLIFAQAGLYGDHSLRNTDAYYLERYFHPQGDHFLVKPEVRTVVRFSRLNLFEEDSMSSVRNVDLILCCNVLIYFDGASKRRVIQRFSSSLLDHGYLFLGHAESLFGISEEFQLVHLPLATAYIKPGRNLARSREEKPL